MNATKLVKKEWDKRVVYSTPLIIQCPPKGLGQFVKLTKYLYPQNTSYPMKYNQFSAKFDAGYQTIWFDDQAPRLFIWRTKR